MSSVGQVEKRTQARVVKLFRDRLGYDYLGNWIDREGNRNIEPELLGAFLKKQGHDDALIGKVLFQLEKLRAIRARVFMIATGRFMTSCAMGSRSKPMWATSPKPCG